VALAPGASPASPEPDHPNGLPLLPWKAQGAPVDLELIDSLRDEIP
jgi:hypothetical protein